MAAFLKLLPIIKEVVSWIVPLISLFKKKKEEPKDECPKEKE